SRILPCFSRAFSTASSTIATRTQAKKRRYSSGMLFWLGITLIAGVAIGALFAWIVSKSGGAAVQQHSAALAAELAQKTAALEAAQRERNAREATHAERDAVQRAQIARLEAGNEHLQQSVK